MRLALAQAGRASGRVWPNPAVGAVVYRGDRLLGSGFTQPPGGPHAEIVAIERARRRHGAAALRGASLAVTLEPCCHHGRTPPCTDAVIAAGIARVAAGHRDPHAAVSGRGFARLRRAGVSVEVGVLEAACRAQHRGFVSVVERGRPFVTLKLAATLDGRIATAAGESRWISGPAARALVHRRRAQVDAIAVGAGTARIDDPELSARRGGRVVHRPIRVVLDAALSLPASARLVRDGGPTWIVCSDAAPAPRRRALAARGVRLLPIRAPRGKIPLARALRLLARQGVGTLWVEGGGTLAAALLREELVDELLWFASPLLLGADARPALGTLGVRRLAAAPALTIDRVRRVGMDLLIEARPRTDDGSKATRSKRPTPDSRVASRRRAARSPR
jgi:diaminohydroxyphosphoribosylaminopyrimidine deaminase/5-amino-6-(5-phosphoribosylamino)uracil reductase